MIRAMADIALKNLSCERTRHGKAVWYYRAGKGKRTRIKGEPCTEKFMQSYWDAANGKEPEKPGRKAYAANTLGWLIGVYRASSAFQNGLAESTKRARENILKRLEEESGRHDLRKITPKAIESGRDRRKAKPEAANSFVKTMRTLFAWAVKEKLIHQNPTTGVDLFSASKRGFHTWTVEEIERYQNHHKLGTRARLAMDLLIFTGLRRSDLVGLGRQHVVGGYLFLRPVKTEETSGIDVTIEILPELAKSIAAGPTGDMTFIVSDRGAPYTKESFTNWFRKQCKAAGVPGSAHGLRKAAATICAENGASEEQLKAMFGWVSGKQAEVYTRAASRKKMAKAAAAFMPGGERDVNAFPRTLEQGAGASPKKPMISKGRK